MALWMDDMSSLRFARIFRGLAIVQASSLPIVIIFALIVHWLHKLRADSLVVVGIVGAVVGLLASLTAVALITSGMPNQHFPRQLFMIPLLVGPGAFVGILYWMLVLRVERAFANLQRRAALAIRAMD